MHLRLYITGQGQDQVQIESKIPVKLVSYSPVVPIADIVRPTVLQTVHPQVSLYQLYFSQQLEPNSVYQATFDETYNQMAAADAVIASDDWRDLPKEIQTHILEADNGTSEFLPDVFALEPGQRVLYSALVTFTKPGVYEIQPGIEYVYKGEKNVAWIESPITVIVPQTYYVWQVFEERDDKLVVGLEGFCQLEQSPLAQCTDTMIPPDFLEVVGIEMFSMKHETIESVEKYTITDNIPSYRGGSISGVWSPTGEMLVLNSEEGIYLYSFDFISAFQSS